MCVTQLGKHSAGSELAELVEFLTVPVDVGQPPMLLRPNYLSRVLLGTCGGRAVPVLGYFATRDLAAVEEAYNGLMERD